MRLGEIRSEPQSLPIAGDGRREFALLTQGIGQVIVSFGMVRFEAQGVPITGDRASQLALSCQHHPEIAMCLGKIRLQSQSPVDVLDSHVVVACVVGEQAQ